MARKTIRVSDQSGQEIADGQGATVRITFADVVGALALRLLPRALAQPVYSEAAEMLAVVRCVECERLQQQDEFWHLRFADIGEVAIYCPVCAEWEFSD